MDSFSVSGYSFDGCLANLSIVLKRCEEVNIVVSYERFILMSKNGLCWFINCVRREKRLIKSRLISSLICLSLFL